MNTIETIYNRCSYRGTYKDTLVPREHLTKIMEAGLAAPSGCNKQTTSLIVELGYQSCWIEGHITDEDRIGYQMAQILNVSDEYELVAFLPVGVAEDECVRVKKLPFEERAWFNGFGKE